MAGRIIHKQFVGDIEGSAGHSSEGGNGQPFEFRGRSQGKLLEWLRDCASGEWKAIWEVAAVVESVGQGYLGDTAVQ